MTRASKQAGAVGICHGCAYAIGDGHAYGCSLDIDEAVRPGPEARRTNMTNRYTVQACDDSPKDAAANGRKRLRTWSVYDTLKRCEVLACIESRADARLSANVMNTTHHDTERMRRLSDELSARRAL